MHNSQQLITLGAEEMIYTTSATASPPTIHRGKWRRINKQDQEGKEWKQSDARWSEGQIWNRGAEKETKEWSELKCVKDEGREGDLTRKHLFRRRLFTESEQQDGNRRCCCQNDGRMKDRKEKLGLDEEVTSGEQEQNRYAKQGNSPFSLFPLLSSFFSRDWAEIPQRTVSGSSGNHGRGLHSITTLKSIDVVVPFDFTFIFQSWSASSDL